MSTRTRSARAGRRGRRSSTRRAPVVEYVGRVAFLVGNRRQRALAKDYLEWLLEQKNGAQSRVDVRGRDDVDVVEAPRCRRVRRGVQREEPARDRARDARSSSSTTPTPGGGADAEIAVSRLRRTRGAPREGGENRARTRRVQPAQPPARPRPRKTKESEPGRAGREREGRRRGCPRRRGGYYYRGSSRGSGSRGPRSPRAEGERETADGGSAVTTATEGRSAVRRKVRQDFGLGGGVAATGAGSRTKTTGDDGGSPRDRREAPIRSSKLEPSRTNDAASTPRGASPAPVRGRSSLLPPLSAVSPW